MAKGRIESLLERQAVALEKLAADPVLEIESGPPICPFCGQIPDVEITEDRGEGPLSTYVIKPKCKHCENEFYAVPLEWAIFQTAMEAEQEINKRAEVFGANVNNG